jgi:Sec7 domain
MLNVFAQVYFEDNVGDSVKCPFPDYEEIYVVVFAMLMLNTDLHCVDQVLNRTQSRQKGGGRKITRKMTKADFINNFLGSERSELVSKDFLSRIYDSIESNPITMVDQNLSGGNCDKQKQTIANMMSNVRLIDSFLRGLAVHDIQFMRADEFASKRVCKLDFQQDLDNRKDDDVLIELMQDCVAKTWHHWYSVINTCMENAHLDPHGMEPSVTILQYALCATICLNMPVERTAFLNQLYRLKAFEEHRQGRWVSSSANHHNLNKDGGQKQRWIEELETCCGGTEVQKRKAMASILSLVQSLQVAIRSDVPNKVGMAAAITEIIDGAFLLHDPSRFYIRSGNLIKKSARTGRQIEYRFYLFSDTLLYASKHTDSSTCNKYKIHEELPLHLMKVVDWFPPDNSNIRGSSRNKKTTGGGSGNTTFEIHHPRKRLQVLCSSLQERKTWVEDIRRAISSEIDRKVKVEQARLSIYNTPSFASSST